MPKYMTRVSFTTEGVKGLQKEKPTQRRAAVAKLLESAGGKLETFYFAFGKTDALVIADLPDHGAAASASLTLAGSGAVTSKITVLLTPEELDQAVKKSGSYTPPGR